MINYDKRRFRLAHESGNSNGTIFQYFQSDNVVWATYEGGVVRYGQAIATADEAGILNLRYQHITSDGKIQTGTCISTPEVLPDGRLRLTEVYQSTSGNQSPGVSIAEEFRD